MINFDDVKGQNTTAGHFPNWSQIPDHPCRI